MANCWDHLNCPEERKNACPAFTTGQGIDCWKVENTLCRGEVQGTAAQKISFCRQCNFFSATAINNKFPIKRKLFAGFGLILAFMLIIGALSYIDINRAKDNYDQLINQRVMVINQTNESLILLQKSALDLRNYLITGDGSYLDNHNAKLLETNASLAKLRSALKTDKGKELFGKYEKQYTIYKTYAGNLINLRQTAPYKNTTENNQIEFNTIKAIQQQTLADKGTIANAVKAGRDLIAYVNDVVKTEQAQVQREVNDLIDFITIVVTVVLIVGCVVALYISNIIAKPIIQLEQAATKIAEGDLTGAEIKIKNRDEVGKLATAFNQMSIALKDLVSHINEKAQTVSAASQELTSTSQQSSASANEASSTLMDLAASVERVAENSNKVQQASETASQSADAGSQGLEQVASQMDTIKDSTGKAAGVINTLNQTSGQITQIVEMITQIAEQTNLLALNAAIEAARAGDQGRGFAVVAEEVRKLAEESGSAAKKIKELIFTIQEESSKAVSTMSAGIQEVEKGTKVVHEVNHSFQHILTSIQELNLQIQDVASSSQQMSAGVQSVAGTAQEQTAVMEELAASSETLASMADELRETSARFKI